MDSKSLKLVFHQNPDTPNHFRAECRLPTPLNTGKSKYWLAIDRLLVTPTWLNLTDLSLSVKSLLTFETVHVNFQDMESVSDEKIIAEIEVSD